MTNPTDSATCPTCGSGDPDEFPTYFCTDPFHTPTPAACPEVVTLCGSTRFKEQHEAENARLTMEGRIVLACGVFGHSDGIELTDEQKAMLDALHTRKIDLSDRIHVIDVGGYIGHSTAAEIRYAAAKGKSVTYLSDSIEGSKP